MPNFRYRASNRQGTVQQGTLMAENRQEAAHQLRTKGLWVTSIVQEGHSLPLSQADKQKAGNSLHFFERSLTRRDALLLCRQLQVMLAGGLPLHEAIRTLARTVQGTSRQRFLQQALRDLQAGRTFAAACQREPQAFPPEVCSLLAAGEASGSLQEILQRLADYLDLSFATQEKLKSALLYPVLLAATSLLAIGLLSIFVLPVFGDLLASFHATLPWPTRLVLGVSGWLQRDWYFFLLGLAACAIGAVLLYRLPAMRLLCGRLRLQLPVLGRLARYSSWQRLCETLAVLLESGIRLDEAIAMLASTTANDYLQARLRQAAGQVRAGHSWQRSLQSVCPVSILDMAAAGEASGHLPLMLRHAARLAGVVTTNELQRLEALAQPVAILVLGGIIFFILLSIALPLLDAMTLVS